MKTYLVYGFLLALANALLQIVLYLLGFQTERLATGQYLSWLGFILMFAVLYFGVVEKRESSPDRSLSFGRAVGTASMIGLFGGLFTALYTYVHFSYINTEFPDYMLDLMKTKWEAAGMSESQIEKIAGMAQFGLKPGFQALASLVMTPLVSLIMGLILGAILKRPPAQAEPPVAG